MVSYNASLSYQEIIEAAYPSQPLFFQLYKHSNDSIAEKCVREVEALGYKAIFLTVDAVMPARRERDVRAPWEIEDMERGTPEVYNGSVDESTSDGVDSLGTAGALIAPIDRDMTWEKVWKRLYICLLKGHNL